MSWFEAGVDVVEAGLKEPFGTLVGIARTSYDLGAGAYDYATGDSEHGKEHMKDAGIDALGSIPGLGKLVNAGKFLYDAGDAMGVGHPADGKEPEPKPDAGKSAGWGALIGMGFGGPLGLLAGAAAGGLIGSKTLPTAKGGFVDPDLGAKAAAILMNPTGEGASTSTSAPTPTDGDDANPYSHYAD